MLLNNFFRWSLPGLAGIICTYGRAQNSDTIKNYLIEEVMISATRTEKKILEIPRSVTLITKQEIQKSGAINLAELLSHQENFNVIGPNQTPGTNQSFFMRGISGEQSMVMIDGIRISDPSSVNNAVDLSEISLIGIDRIEIVRGAHSTLYGSSAIGGVINLITEKGSIPGLNMNLNIDAGMFGKGTGQLTENLNLNYTFNNGFYVNGHLFRSDVRGLDAALDTVTTEGVFKNNDRDDFRKTDAVARIGYQGNNLNVYMSYKNASQFSDIDQEAFINDENNKVELSRDLLNYGIDYKLSENMHLILNGGGSIVTRTNENDSSLISAIAYDRNYYKGTFKGSLFNNELQLNYDRENTKIVFGGGAYYEAMTSHSYTYSGFWNYESETDLDTLDLHSLLFNAYISADISGKIISNRLDALSLMMGLRFNSDNRNGKYFTFEFNPYYKLSGKSILFASLATGFNSPSLYKLYTPEVYYTSGITRGNPALEPEKSLSAELGLKQLIGHNLVLTLSAYQNTLMNSIRYVYLWDSEIGLDTVGMDWMRDDYRGDTYLNLGRMTTRGIEFSLWTMIGNKITVKGNLILQQGSLEYMPDDIDISVTRGHHVQLYESGKFLDQQAKIDRLARRYDCFNLYVGYQIGKSSDLALNINHTGKKDDIFYSMMIMPFGALDTRLLDSYTLYHLSFRQQISKSVTLSLRIQNLFNKSYTELLGYSTRGRGFYLNIGFSL
ncbi:MAG: TonB-dependent receptor [Bacteroidales bacterium]|nr:TonB-dependent receptor [Bacteroidales bacterium]